MHFRHSTSVLFAAVSCWVSVDKPTGNDPYTFSSSSGKYVVLCVREPRRRRISRGNHENIADLEVVVNANKTYATETVVVGSPFFRLYLFKKNRIKIKTEAYARARMHRERGRPLWAELPTPSPANRSCEIPRVYVWFN